MSNGHTLLVGFLVLGGSILGYYISDTKHEINELNQQNEKLKEKIDKTEKDIKSLEDADQKSKEKLQTLEKAAFDDGRASSTDVRLGTAPTTKTELQLRVKVTPPNARIEVAGVVLTEPVLRVKKGQMIEIVVSAPDYETETKKIGPVQIGGDIVFDLEKSLTGSLGHSRGTAPPV